MTNMSSISRYGIVTHLPFAIEMCFFLSVAQLIPFFLFSHFRRSSESSSSSSDSSMSSPGMPEGQAWTRDAAFSAMHSIMRAVSPPNIPNKVTSPSDLAHWRSGADSSAANQLGSGANGAVYLYKHAKTQQPIALKKFKLPGNDNYRMRRLINIKKEAGIQKALANHFYFPQYYGCIPLNLDSMGNSMEFVGEVSRNIGRNGYRHGPPGRHRHR